MSSIDSNTSLTIPTAGHNLTKLSEGLRQLLESTKQPMPHDLNAELYTQGQGLPLQHSGGGRHRKQSVSQLFRRYGITSQSIKSLNKKELGGRISRLAKEITSNIARRHRNVVQSKKSRKQQQRKQSKQQRKQQQRRRQSKRFSRF